MLLYYKQQTTTWNEWTNRHRRFPLKKHGLNLSIWF